MASGSTTTAALADSLPTLISAARIVREHEGIVPQLVEKHTLGVGIGNTWNEVTMAQLTAQGVNEDTELNNPQQISDTLFSITPTVIGIQTRVTDRVAQRISKNAYAKIGSLAQNAVQRKKNADGITVFDGFSNSHPGSGSTTLTSGHISAGMAKIQGNATEPGNPPFRLVLHPYQIRDIEDEIVAGVGTYPVGDGITARVFTEGFRGMIAGAQLYPDGNISIASNQAKGGLFAQEAIVIVQGRSPWVWTDYRGDIGGGATDIFMYDEYAYGERQDAWGIEIFSDSTAPTS